MKTLKTTAALTTVILATAACQQGNTSYNQNPKTYQGAGIGAAVGGLAGALTGDNERERWTRGAIGAGVGAVAGGAIGQYMDNQEQQMRQATAGTPVQVNRQGNDLFLNMPSNVTFAFDSSNIRSDFKPTLNNVANVLNNYPQTMVEIMGHTDSTGDENYNMNLSERRASAVANYLRSVGVQQRMITTGLGETQPVASNNTEAGRAQNRRVEIKISPITQ